MGCAWENAALLLLGLTSSPRPHPGRRDPLPGSIPDLSRLSFLPGNLPSHPQLWPLPWQGGGGKGVPGPGSGATSLRPSLQSLYSQGRSPSGLQHPPVADPPAPERRSERDSAPFPLKALGCVGLSARPRVLPPPCHGSASCFKHLRGQPGLRASTDVAVRGLGVFPALPPAQEPRCPAPAQVLGCYVGMCRPHGAPPSAGMLASSWRLGSGPGRWRVVSGLRHLQPFLYKLIKENTGKNQTSQDGVTSFVLCGRGKRESGRDKDAAITAQSITRCWLRAPVQSPRDALGVRGLLPACTAPRVCKGLHACPVPRVARARWSLLWGPPRQPQGCFSKPGTPRALGWRELRGDLETPGSERPQSPPVPRGRGISV